MRDERERKDRVWRWTLRGVVALVALSVAGFAVWMSQPPRLELEVVLEARDGTLQPVRVARETLGDSPVTLTLDELRERATPELLEEYRALRAGTHGVVHTLGMDLGRDARLEVVVVETSTPETWLEVRVQGAAEEAHLALPVSLGPEAAPYAFGSQGHRSNSYLVLHDVRCWLAFTAP